MRRALLLASLLTAGCERGVYADWDGEKTASVADVADANARTALMRAAELSDKIQQLESDKDDLERKARDLESENDRLERALQGFIDHHNGEFHK